MRKERSTSWRHELHWCGLSLTQAAKTAKSACTQSENIAMSLTARALVRGRVKRFFFVFCNLHHVPLRLFVEPCARGHGFARYAPLFLCTAHAAKNLARADFYKNDDAFNEPGTLAAVCSQTKNPRGRRQRTTCRLCGAAAAFPFDFDAMRKKRPPTEGKTSIGNRSLSEKQVLRPDARGGAPAFFAAGPAGSAQLV